MKIQKIVESERYFLMCWLIDRQVINSFRVFSWVSIKFFIIIILIETQLNIREEKVFFVSIFRVEL